MLKSVIRTVKLECGKPSKCLFLAFIILVIPVAVNLLLGFEFQKGQISQIPMAVLDQDNSYLSRSIVQQFRENETFDVKYSVDNADEIKSLIDQSRVRVGIVIPEGFSRDVASLNSPTVLMLYDGSHMSIVSAAKTKASEILMTVKSGIVIKQLQGRLNMTGEYAKNTALAVRFESRMLYNPAKNFGNFLIPGLGIAIVQTAIAMMCSASVKREELEPGILKRTGYILGKIIFFGILGVISFSLCFFIQTSLFGLPLRGNTGDIILLGGMLSFSVAAFSIMVSVLLLKRQMFSMTITAVFIIPSTVLGGYTWPVLSMPYIYQQYAKILPFYHFADNYRDMLLKGISINNIQKDIIWFALFTAVTACIALAAACFAKPAVGIGSPHVEKEVAGVEGF